MTHASKSENSKEQVSAHGDETQKLLVDYAVQLDYDRLSKEAVFAAKTRVIDTLGALIGGFPGESCRIARNVSYQLSQLDGSTVLGTRHKTSPDMAAFVNATTSRYVEMNDAYHHPGSTHGHPSDMVTPVLSAAEHAHASGKELLAAIALAYEVYLQFSDHAQLKGFDNSTFVGFGVALGAAKLFGLTQGQIGEALSMAVVPNNALNQSRSGELSMWKAAASGQAGRAGVFAAILARAGMQGPKLPFEGKEGWFNNVSHRRVEFPAFGGGGRMFKVEESLIKLRPSGAPSIPSIIAAENAYKNLGNSDEITRVVVEVDGHAMAGNGVGAHHWNPTNRESADHSIPYVVAAALYRGLFSARLFDAAHINDPKLRSILAKVEVEENPEFSKEFESPEVVHHARVTVELNGGEKVVGEALGDASGLAKVLSEAEINQKFAMLTEDLLGNRQVGYCLDSLWKLESMDDVAKVPRLLVI